MEKKPIKEYKFDNENHILREPAIEYGIQEEIKIQPLTEEDLKNCITGDELREFMHQMIDEHFDK